MITTQRQPDSVVAPGSERLITWIHRYPYGMCDEARFKAIVQARRSELGD